VAPFKKSMVKQQSSSEQFFTEREQHLKKEYATLTEYIKDYSDRVDRFQDENELLDKEAQEIQENNKAYLTYLAKRTLLCQNAIITLNDQNRSDLASVLKQKDELTSQYKDREKEVRSQLIEMETKYSLMNKEVDDLRPFKELQSDQLSRIWDKWPHPSPPSRLYHLLLVSSTFFFLLLLAKSTHSSL
uniref:DUF4515 domain-containing protein n=1 Tax=Pseudonaja textilis TaxID=8673 RepID=A0A670ZW92_PSETE